MVFYDRCPQKLPDTKSLNHHPRHNAQALHAPGKVPWCQAWRDCLTWNGHPRETNFQLRQIWCPFKRYQKGPKIPKRIPDLLTKLFLGGKLLNFRLFRGNWIWTLPCPSVRIPQSGVETAVKGAATASPKNTQNKMHQSLVVLWTHSC